MARPLHWGVLGMLLLVGGGAARGEGAAGPTRSFLRSNTILGWFRGA